MSVEGREEVLIKDKMSLWNSNQNTKRQDLCLKCSRLF